MYREFNPYLQKEKDNAQREIDKYIKDDMLKKWDWLENNHPEHQLLFMIAKGSMNYGMMVFTEDYQSDVDVEAAILPTLDDIIRGREMISKTYIMEDNSHVTVRDIRLFKDLLYKQNLAFLELLYSKYWIASDIGRKIHYYLQSRSKEISELDKTRLLKSLKGMMYEKQKALTHPYPVQKDEIEQYGYASKQYHHIVRLYFIASGMIFYGWNYGRFLIPFENKRKLLIDYKTKHFDKEEVLERADKIVNETKELVDNYLEKNNFIVNQELINEIDEYIYKFIEESIIESTKG